MPTIKQPCPIIHCNGREVRPKFSNACGNTFLVYDLLPLQNTYDWEAVKKSIWNIMKDIRVNGAPVDDALVLRKICSDADTLDVKMHVLEPDSTEADFCGNGARAVGTFLFEAYGKQYPRLRLGSRMGMHELTNKDGICFVNMGKPVIINPQRDFFHQGIKVTMTYVDAVEPHLVTRSFFDPRFLEQIGVAINATWKSEFPAGVNVNCVKLTPEKNELEVMTYERGVYRITQACGTGSTACCAALIHHQWRPTQPRYTVKLLGGTLNIHYQDSNEFLIGGDVKFSEFEK